MRTKAETDSAEAEKRVRDIRRATRRQYSAEEKIRIVIAGLRGEDSIAELCRKEGINQVWRILRKPPDSASSRAACARRDAPAVQQSPAQLRDLECLRNYDRIRPIMTASSPDSRACRCLRRPGGGCRTRLSYGSRLAAFLSDTDSSAPSSCAAGHPSER
jgi:transposase-like protein